MSVIELDWATQKATRIIKGYRIVGGKGRELRDDIAKALRAVESEARVQEPPAPVEVAPLPLSERIKTSNMITYAGATTFEARGFLDVDEAKKWARNWELNNFGYTPLASVAETKAGEIVVFCKRWNSCD